MSGSYGGMPPPPDGTINPTSIAEQSPISPLTTQSSPISALQTTSAGNGYGMDSEAAWFNFDMAGLGDFGSRYGAMEFGALGQFQGGNNVVSNAGYETTFSPNSPAFPLGYSTSDEINSTWGGTGPNSRNNSTPGPGMGGLNFPNTYTIAAAPSSLTSPSPPAPSPQPLGGSSATSPGYHELSTTSPNIVATSGATTGGFYRPPQTSGVGSFNGNYPQLAAANQNHLQQRRPKPPLDPSTIYQTVSKPYPYPEHFHRLFHLIETRFPRQSVVRIARSFALFRPSFIACTQTLKEPDLVFMEKCFQRTLWEYEKFIQSCGTPTIVCRRTGEVAAVGKEFCMLTGWSKEVLLGEKTNLNTNFVGAGKPLNPVAPSRSAEFPKDVEEDMKPATPKPVFLAELLDEESVVQFYEEFAKMAFGDSRGSVTTRCKVLKYTPPAAYDDKGNEIKTRTMGLGGGKDGKVECVFCWTIKRDVFDIPMLIVGNFLPILEGPTGN
ncbi:hypothetical protein BJ508DRAFT_326588 [Ascobolus immersus RN42]|uniref:ERT1/acuK family PAS domain-containing protein n=1 Tax=Ascobolus immersus RN42 TaxID=1160509 RepID=A0A3N4IAI2_ASCIM|nr:hypothetical protein BJ508DRAFT_326588 [Ascobolus immersus RN42]